MTPGAPIERAGDPFSAERRAPSPAFSAIGAQLEQRRRELYAWCTELLGLVDGAYAPTVEQSMRHLEGQSCRIAVIGQVKAGKTSFINALVGRPNLLPSDVNPWTAVVTNLHFYHADPPEESAHFTFFDNDEWRRIAEAGGPLRELTERLVPGFDPQLLGAQLRSMQLRATQRHGANLGSLLGQRHSFAALTPDLLERYISAGHEAQAEGAAGWYADIVKSADLYFGAGRPGYPLVVVDTPGTNDPLLVRDEITRLNLTTAEIYVVVLTAQQPLSIGDLALLRMLRGLHKDRIIVFINRADGLRDIGEDTGRIAQHVQKRLREEFPSTNVPVIVGSALWANGALPGHEAAAARLVNDQLRTYARARGIGPIEPLLPGQRATPALQSTLFTLSGIPDVLGAINDMMQNGNTAFSTRQIARMLLQIAHSSEVTARGEVLALARASDDAKVDATSRGTELQQWRRELQSIDAASRELQANLAVYEQSLRSMVERCTSDLRLLLGRCLERLVTQQVAELSAAYHHGRIAVWSCDSQPLRDDLQREFLRVYRHWDGQLTRAHELMAAQLQAVMQPATPAGSAPQRPPSRINAQPHPNVSALGRPLALDLEVPWWKALWAGRPTLASRVTEFERVIGEEFDPLIEDLIRSGVAALDEQCQYVSRQARMSTIDIVEAIQRRSQELLAGLQGSGPATDADVARFEQQIRAAEAKLVRWVELRSGLSAVVEACETA